MRIFQQTHHFKNLQSIAHIVGVKNQNKHFSNIKAHLTINCSKNKSLLTIVIAIRIIHLNWTRFRLETFTGTDDVHTTRLTITAAIRLELWLFDGIFCFMSTFVFLKWSFTNNFSQRTTGGLNQIGRWPKSHWFAVRNCSGYNFFKLGRPTTCEALNNLHTHSQSLITK